MWELEKRQAGPDYGRNSSERQGVLPLIQRISEEAQLGAAKVPTGRSSYCGRTLEQMLAKGGTCTSIYLESELVLVLENLTV